MPFTLTDVRADLDALLANAGDAATWSAAMKDAGIRSALLLYSLHGPVYEDDVVVAQSGHSQDLSGLSDLLVVEAIGWPWYEGAILEEQVVRWRRTGATSVRMDQHAPQAGDRMRVRYRRRHFVAGLDGAAATTAPDAHRAILAEGATVAVLAMRLRQISENPALPREAAVAIEERRLAHEEQFMWLLQRMQGEPQMPVWATVGL